MALQWNASPMILHAATSIFEKLDEDMLQRARRELVDGVIDQFKQKVVEPLHTGIPDVHARTTANVQGIPQDVHILGRIAFVILAHQSPSCWNPEEGKGPGIVCRIATASS